MHFTAACIAVVLCCLGSSQCMLYPKDSDSRQTKLLDGVWNFRVSKFEDQDQGFREEWFKKPLSQSGPVIPMPVPSSYNDITQERLIRDYIGWVWYEKEFFVSSNWKNERIVLRFGSVNYCAKAYINGVPVVSHTGGHLPFEAEVGSYLLFSGKNTITVAVNNTLTPDTIPQGSVKYYNDTKRYPKDFYESSVNFDFFNYAGIHRSVVLYTTPLVYISDFTVITDFDNSTGLVEFFVKNGSPPSRNKIATDPSCVVSIYDKLDQLVGKSNNCNDKISIDNVKLWWPYTMNPDPGYLYTMKIELYSNTAVDVYYQKIGVRTVQVTSDEFLINGKPFYFTGFGKHEDANIRGKGLDFPIIIKDFNLIKWVGANSFRTSHYPYSEELMDQADEQGIVVIDECPAVGLNKFNNGLLAIHLGIMEELISRDKNRPSVVLWSVANEPTSSNKDADSYFKTVVTHTKSLDPSRPVTAALNAATTADLVAKYMDVIMRNRYFAWYSDAGYGQVIVPQLLDEFRNSRRLFKRPTLISEYGADTIPGFHMSPSVMFTEDYQTEFMIQYHKAFDQLRREGGFVGEHIWNFADFMTVQGTTRVVGNKKGIFTRERQPKAAAKLLRCRYFMLANMTVMDDAVYCPASNSPLLF